MRSFLQLSFFIFTLLILSCKGKVSDTTDVADILPSDFKVFYEKFSTDSVFQMESIVFPLDGRPSMKDGVDSIPVDFKWQKENWIIHKKYNDANGNFSRSYTVFNDIVSEDVRDDSGQFTMIRRFAKMADGWKMIYYKEMGL